MGRRIGVLAVIVLAAVAMIGVPMAGAAKVRKPGPTRVLLVGDSITGFYAPTAAAALRAKGYQVTTAGVSGTGLLDLNVWNGSRAKQLRTGDPDVVVIEYTGNYPPWDMPSVTPRSPVVPYGSKKWFNQWKASAKKQTRLYAPRPGVRVVWVLVPKTNSAGTTLARSFASVIPTRNSIYRGLGTRTVDAWSAFGGNTYNPALHLPDGIHPNVAGQQLLASLVVAAVG